MGYQESYIRFRSEKRLKNALNILKTHPEETFPARVLCVSQAIKPAPPIKKGEVVLVAVGDRSGHNAATLGLKGVRAFVPIDNYFSLADQKGTSLDAFLESHFHVLNPHEEEALLGGEHL